MPAVGGNPQTRSEPAGDPGYHPAVSPAPGALERHRARLLAAREALLQGPDHDVRVEGEPTPVASKVDEDAQPLTIMSQVIASNRNAERKRRLQEIYDALARLHDEPEDFDRCASCDEPLPARRLELVPWAQLCIECQREREHDAPRGRRNLTDYRE